MLNVRILGHIREGIYIETSPENYTVYLQYYGILF